MVHELPFRTQFGTGQAVPPVVHLVELRPWTGCGRRPRQLLIHPEVAGAEVVAGECRRQCCPYRRVARRVRAPD